MQRLNDIVGALHVGMHKPYSSPFQMLKFDSFITVNARLAFDGIKFLDSFTSHFARFMRSRILDPEWPRKWYIVATPSCQLVNSARNKVP